MSFDGYIYVPGNAVGPLTLAAPGVRVANPSDAPPWIVVDHTIERIIVTAWPGRLFTANIVALAPEQVGAAAERGSSSSRRVGASYTRATAVDIVAELPTAALFGDKGDKIEAILRFANQLSLQQAEGLAAYQHAEADSLYTKAWNQWLESISPTSIHLGSDHRDTLGIPTPKAQSPANSAFMVMHRCVWRRAEQVTAGAAILVDAEGEQSLAEPWRSASSAMLFAAMAELTIISPDDNSKLAAAYHAVRNRGPATNVPESGQ